VSYDDTTEQIIPWKPPPPRDVVIMPSSIHDPDHTVYAPLDGTVMTPAPGRVQKVGVVGKRILMFLLIFDVLFGTFTIIVLSRMQKPFVPGVVADTTPEPVPTVTVPVTTPVPTVTVTTRVQTTVAPLTTVAPSTQAPKTTAACKP
jgi:hypothetical protein